MRDAVAGHAAISVGPRRLSLHRIITTFGEGVPIIGAMSYAELHFHLLPGIDDGPPSMEASLELARAAAAEGTRMIVATPHVNPTCPNEVGELPDRTRAVAERLRRERIPIEVRCGAELGHQMVPRLSGAELETISHGPPGRRWLLLEAPLQGLSDDFTAAADELRDRRFAIVVAHPERALADYHAGWRALEHELGAGSAMQINAWSLAGLYGDRIQLNSFRVLQAASLVAIASDAHGPERMPALSLALDALAATGVRDPTRFAASNPRALLERGLSLQPSELAA